MHQARGTVSRSSQSTDKQSNLKTTMRSRSAQRRSSVDDFSYERVEESKHDLMEYCEDTPVVEEETPTETQLVLLCLDYLRSLRRSSSVSRNDLEIECGINQDYITVAIYALSKAFTRAPELQHGDINDTEKCLDRPLEFGNDPYFQPDYSHLVSMEQEVKNRSSFQLTKNIIIPSLEMMESELLYKTDPRKGNSVANEREENSSDFGLSKGHMSNGTSINPHRSAWYEYTDEHYSNQHRFYETMGLSSSSPLKLPDLVSKGLQSLKSKSRFQAEENMMSDALFTNFVEAVSKNGFFHITEKEIMAHSSGKVGMSDDEIILVSDKIHEERFRKVTTKFRTKLAAKYEEDEKLRKLEEQVKEKENEEKEVEEQGQPRDMIETISEEDQVENEYDYEQRNENIPQEQPYEQDDDDATLVAASVFGDIASNETETAESVAPGVNDDDCSRVSRSSRHSRMSLASNVDRKDLETAERLKGYGNASMQKKKYEKAKNYYTKALELIPAGPTSHVYFSNRAAALLSMRNFNEAVWDAERSIALKPDYAKAHARLGLAHFLLEHYEDAVEAYTLAVKYDPDNETSVSYLEKSKKKLASAHKDIADAEEYIASAQKKMKNQPLAKDDALYEGGKTRLNVKGLNDAKDDDFKNSRSMSRSNKRSTEVQEQNDDYLKTRPRSQSRRKAPSNDADDVSLSERPYSSKSRPRSQRRRESNDADDVSLSERPYSSKSRPRSQRRRETNDADDVSLSERPYSSKSRPRTQSSRMDSTTDDDISLNERPYSSRSRLSTDKIKPTKKRNPSRRQMRQISLEPSGDAAEIVELGGDPPEERSMSPPRSASTLRSRLEKVRESPSGKRLLSSDEELMKDPPVLKTGSGDSTNLSDDDEEADRLKGEGNKAMARKQYEKAVKYYSKSLRLSPAGHNSHVYFSNRAAALCYLERYEEAELDAERSLALNPEYGKAHARLGLSRYFLRDYYGAVEAYEAAVLYDPNNAASKSYLSKAKSKIGKRSSGSRASSRTSSRPSTAGSARGIYIE
jgi:stress-induced-phosphoprotein 1